VEIEVGLRGQEVVQVVLARRGSHCQATPPNIDIQLLGGVPSSRASAHTYQSALGLSRLSRLSRNQACSTERVAEHLVDHHLEAQRMRLGQQAVEVARVPNSGSTSR
jgi:hypothetical protein